MEEVKVDNFNECADNVIEQNKVIWKVLLVSYVAQAKIPQSLLCWGRHLHNDFSRLHKFDKKREVLSHLSSLSPFFQTGESFKTENFKTDTFLGQCELLQGYFATRGSMNATYSYCRGHRGRQNILWSNLLTDWVLIPNIIICINTPYCIVVYCKSDWSLWPFLRFRLKNFGLHLFSFLKPIF